MRFSFLLEKRAAALSLAGALFFALAQSGCAKDQPAPPPVEDRFEAMDVNRDGKVVLEEFQTAMPGLNEDAFLFIDKNGDKGLDRVEWTEFVKVHNAGSIGRPEKGAPMNNIPGDPLIPPVDSNDLPLMRPPVN